MLNLKKTAICFLILLSLPSFLDTARAYDVQYAKALRQLDERVQREKEAYAYERANDFEKAIDAFEEVVRDYGNLVASSSARNALIRLYEQTGQNEKALEQVEWFLKGNQSEQGRQASLADQRRLLRKIEAQRRGEEVEEPNPASVASQQKQSIRRISDFHAAGYDTQQQFLEKELPEDTKIHWLSKQAMLTEHAGEFSEAKNYYAQLLEKKADVIAAFGEAGWVMLYPAVQRTSEVTGDEAREKAMLVWIRDNMLLDSGEYHRYLRGLLPSVQDHLRERLEEFDLSKQNR